MCYKNNKRCRNYVDVFHFLKIKLTAWASYRTTHHLCKQLGLAGASNIRHKRKWHYFVKKVATNVGLKLSFYILNWLHICLPLLNKHVCFSSSVFIFRSLSLSMYVWLNLCVCVCLSLFVYLHLSLIPSFSIKTFLFYLFYLSFTPQYLFIFLSSFLLPFSFPLSVSLILFHSFSLSLFFPPAPLSLFLSPALSLSLPHSFSSWTTGWLS